MANLKEKYQSFIRSETRKALLGRQTIDNDFFQRRESLRRVIDVFGALDQLKEVRDNIWEEGTLTNSGTNSIGLFNLLLSTSFIEYYPPHTIHKSNYDDSWSEEAPSCVYDKSVVMVISTGIHENYQTHTHSMVWDGKSVDVSFEALCGKLREESSVYKGSFIVDSTQSITPELKDQFGVELNKVLFRLNKESISFPISVTRSQARQDIINRVLSGELKRSALPGDFDY